MPLRGRNDAGVAATPRHDQLCYVLRRRFAPFSLTLEPARIVVSSAGDVAYETGACTLSMDGPKGQRVEDAGKFVGAWKDVGNEWKAVLSV